MKLSKEARRGLYTNLMESLCETMKEKTYQKMVSLLEDAEPEAPAHKKENKEKVPTVKKEKFLKDTVTLVARPSGTDQKFSRIFLFHKIREFAYDVYIFYINPENGKIVLVQKRGYNEADYKKNCTLMLHKILGVNDNKTVIREICIEKDEIKTFFEWLDKDVEKILTAINDSFKETTKAEEVEECNVAIKENDEPDRSKENLPDNKSSEDNKKNDNQKKIEHAKTVINSMIEDIQKDSKAFGEYIKLFGNIYNLVKKQNKSYVDVLSELNSKFNKADKK